MNKKVPLGVAVTVILLAVALTVSATMMLSMRYFSSMVSDVGQRQAMYDYIDEIDSAARKHYVIDEEKLRAALAEGYIDGLEDIYAEYLSAEEYKSIQSTLAGNRTGFGFEVTVSSDNQLIVSKVDANSPAALSGVTKGDILLAIDGEAVDGSLYTVAQSKLDSTEKLVLTIGHSGLQSAVELTANTYTLVSVEGRMITENIGYIDINGFNNLTSLQFKNTYNELMQAGAMYFVFDLRSNNGGSLDAAKEMLDYLLPRGYYASCEVKNGREIWQAEDTYEMTAPTVTLVNGSTSGEAELFAGALQAQGKTQLVGTSTQGKAVAQDYLSIDSDKAAVKLTIGKITLLPNNTNWMDTGLYPNHLQDLSYDKLLYFDLLTDEQDTQLQKAIDVLKNSNIVSLENGTKATTATTTAAETTTTTTKK